MTINGDRTPSRPRSGLVTLTAWGLVVLCAPLCLAWVLGARVYMFDIVASQQALISWGALAVALLLAAIRRRGAVLAMLALLIISAAPLLSSRRWSLPSVDLEHKTPDTLRIVSSNIHPRNPRWRQDTRELMGYGADVVILLELAPTAHRAIKLRGYLEGGAYPYWINRAWVENETSICYLLSRWPIEPLGYGGDPQDAKHHLHVRVAHPSGDVIVGLMHPVSPRTPSRWRAGNRIARAQATEARRLHEQTGLPVLIGADLNAAPAQTRGRAMRTQGLSMTKPLLRPRGSFPTHSGVPGWASPQLDDVWVLGPVEPVAWSMREPLGSDHRAVIVDLRLREER